MEFSKKQRENLAKIFINIGSIVLAGFGIGFFSTDLISTREFIFGIIFAICSFFWAIKIDKE
ncbi:MAG: hypothetical protein FVQ77_09050 [Cytophagales bacterium]|nr:hypothetical protein [Cytophagales bacterium]